MNEHEFVLPELRGAFSGTSVFGKVDLRCFYQKRSPSLSEPAFRRILYALERRDQIISVDAGVYRFPNGHTASPCVEEVHADFFC